MKHSELVLKLSKSGEKIKNEISPMECNLMHMVFGICGESGELLDAVKKGIIYRKMLDRENIIEELGDLEFYLEGFRQALLISREEIIEANIKKLSARYGSGLYTDESAIERKDKFT